ncbi:PucR family transcriptional regulator [Nocardioides marmoriginsengisoli]|uniref:PucR family transcriptional regulator n=1 Tax=Nocardioides marmoriginsengisoli TaxID=661483 RepID=A0A3N0CN41_9ACTN|nr:PucR family transcriptional regulator [Nocardioides marmoriginsengisoli]RNL64845.1 PucR family transcriptional regulator [Nocardioides marmoriginsengisoli]
MRSAADPLGGRIARVIQERVQVFAGPVTGKRHRLIALATRSAIEEFFDQLTGRGPSGRRVDELFAKMGHGEATDGHTLAPILEALEHARLLAWDEVRALVVRLDGAAAVLSGLHDEIERLHTRLRTQVERGYAAGERAVARSHGGPRRELLRGLVEGADRETLVALALAAGSDLPAAVVLASIEGEPDLTGVPGILSDLVDGELLALAAAPDRDRLIETLTADLGVRRAAVSWSVATAHADDARRWVGRALELADQGVLLDERVLDCDQHRTLLWLYAEPHLRRQLCQELLGPLLAESPHSRQILAETLSVWLEMRASAPAIAARLDVHPQTIRYRWKRINELLGDALREPELIVQLTMLLKASVPLWRTGDQSDFPRQPARDRG